MRADRLLSILLLLQLHSRLTARQLAKRLEVSERTILRDMEALGVAGVPVLAERGVGGGWRLLDGYKTNVSGLNEHEVQALFATRPSKLLADLKLDKASDAALVKLLSVLPAVNRRGAELAWQRIHIDVSGWTRSREPVPHLPALQQAVMNDRRIRILYEREGCTSERTLDPLGLIAKGMTWYVAGGIDDDVRTYRVSRIREVELLDSFIRPPDFDLAAFWERSQESFRERLPRFQVVARIRPEAMPLFRAMIRFGAIDEVNGDVVTMHFDAEEVARINLRGFGDAVEIIEGLTL
ncbi:MAG TPA: WYL domain-containing protein [Thermoanaerobaculia bacterium]|nr:WYL domain-containing protein [Thermoanaerobaculia bacterium]